MRASACCSPPAAELWLVRWSPRGMAPRHPPLPDPCPLPHPQSLRPRTWHTALIALSVFCVKISPKPAPLSWTVNLPQNRLALNLINMGGFFSPYHKHRLSYVTMRTHVVSLESWYEDLSLGCYHSLLPNVGPRKLFDLITVRSICRILPFYTRSLQNGDRIMLWKVCGMCIVWVYTPVTYERVTLPLHAWVCPWVIVLCALPCCTHRHQHSGGARHGRVWQSSRHGGWQRLSLSVS